MSWSSAPGGAGLFTALTAARAGARVALVSATPLAQTASYWAQGGIAAALATDDSAELHREDTERAGRGLVRRSAAEILVREAPGAVEELERLGVRLRRRPPRQPRARPRGRPLAPPRRPRRRQRDRAAGGARPVRARRRPRGRRGPRVDARGARCGPPTAAASASCARTAGRCGRAPSCSSTGGTAALWSRTTNPPGSLGIGLQLAREAGAALADLELMQFHPTAVTGVPGREGFLVTEAVRGEGATLLDAAGRALRRGARPARRGRAGDLGPDGRDRRRPRRPRHARDRPGALPERRRRAAPVRRRPGARARPGGPGGALRDGRGRRRPRRRDDGPRPLRGRRDGVHGAARGQPPRVELAERVLRVRGPRRPCRPRRAGRWRPASRRPGASWRSRRARPARRCGSTRASCATGGAHPPARRPARPRAAHRRPRAAARGDARGPRAPGLPADGPATRRPPHGDDRRRRRRPCWSAGTSRLPRAARRARGSGDAPGRGPAGRIPGRIPDQPVSD